MADRNFAGSMGSLVAAPHSKSGFPQRNCPFIWLALASRVRPTFGNRQHLSLSQLELHDDIPFPCNAILGDFSAEECATCFVAL